MAALRFNNTLSQNNIGKKRRFTGRNDSIAVFDAIIKGRPMRHGNLRGGAQRAVQDLIHRMMHRVGAIGLRGVAATQSGMRYISIERQNRKHGGQNARHGQAIGPDQAMRMGRCGIIAINDRDFIAMPHGAQSSQQFRAKHRIKPNEHQM